MDSSTHQDDSGNPPETLFAALEGDLASYVSVEDLLFRFDIEVTADDIPTTVLEIVDRTVETPENGFFGPGSMVWEVFNDQALYLGTPAGIVLQVAHPKVGQGVADHGMLQFDPVERLHRTFDAFHAILFGDVITAVRSVVTLRTIHERVTGSLESAAGPFDNGESYYAHDPELLLWVAATLIEIPLRTYQLYIGRLSDDEIEQFYDEMKTFGELMGIPHEEFPTSYDAFTEYFQRILDDEIVDSTASRRVIDGFLEQSPAPRTVEFLVCSVLSESAREAVGFEWGPVQQQLSGALAVSIRSVPRQFVPDRVRYQSRYRHFNRHKQC